MTYQSARLYSAASNAYRSPRFAIENPIQFDDFTNDELLQVLNLKLKEQDLEATEEAKQTAIETLGRSRNRPNFGNGDEVSNHPCIVSI